MARAQHAHERGAVEDGHRAAGHVEDLLGEGVEGHRAGHAGHVAVHHVGDAQVAQQVVDRGAPPMARALDTRNQPHSASISPSIESMVRIIPMPRMVRPMPSQRPTRALVRRPRSGRRCAARRWPGSPAAVEREGRQQVHATEDQVEHPDDQARSR